MEKDRYHDYGAAPLKAEGQAVDYETRKRTPEETIEYLKQQLHLARIDQSRYRRVKRLATNQKLMVANKDGFTLVEDLDDYMDNEAKYAGPLTRADIIQEGLQQLEQAFDDSYAMTKATP